MWVRTVHGNPPEFVSSGDISPLNVANMLGDIIGGYSVEIRISIGTSLIHYLPARLSVIRLAYAVLCEPNKYRAPELMRSVVSHFQN